MACFDTALNTTIPAAAHAYVVPERWRTELAVLRYGLHGPAHERDARRTAHLGRPLDRLRIVTAHLGSGASQCAVDRGRSADTTMGLTPTAGLAMGTRSGDLDPAVLLWLLDQGLDHADVADAETALQVWAHRSRAQIAAMAAALSGLDALSFSGGIGEHQPRIRARITDRLGFLGIALDTDHNPTAGAEDDITPSDAPVSCLVVTVREDLVIARQIHELLARRPR